MTYRLSLFSTIKMLAVQDEFLVNYIYILEEVYVSASASSFYYFKVLYKVYLYDLNLFK